MEIKNISHDLPFKSSIGIRPLHSIEMAVVHHTGTKAGIAGYDFMARARSFANYHISKGWGHIAYHYMIDRNGKVYQCYSETEIGAQAGVWDINKKSLAICLDGDFVLERPTAVQIGALWGMLDYLTRERPDLPLLVKQTVRTHREVRPTPTT